MTRLASRGWVPPASETYVQDIAARVARESVEAIDASIHALIEANRAIYEDDCVNLNPAGNAMNPRAEAAMAAGLSSRPSLGYPGDKYEMGLEAVEQIEVIAAELAAEVFGARYAEIRRLGRARQSLCFHGDRRAGRSDHCAAGGNRRPCHAS